MRYGMSLTEKGKFHVSTTIASQVKIERYEIPDEPGHMLQSIPLEYPYYRFLWMIEEGFFARDDRDFSVDIIFKTANLYERSILELPPVITREIVEDAERNGYYYIHTLPKKEEVNENV